MRNKFEELLETLNEELVVMGGLCEQAVRGAMGRLWTDAREEQSEVLQEDVRALEREIDRKERDIESLCMRLILRQQPVARDLRLISAALKLISDMERIGDQAVDIVELLPFITRIDNRNGIDGYIQTMSDTAVTMITASVNAFARRDTALAQSVIKQDDVVDECFEKVKNAIVEIISTEGGDGMAALDLLLVAKYLERVGDHAVNIAEWAEFLESGVHKGAEVV
jgi:phosphate transport system protein